MTAPRAARLETWVIAASSVAIHAGVFWALGGMPAARATAPRPPIALEMIELPVSEPAREPEPEPAREPVPEPPRAERAPRPARIEPRPEPSPEPVPEPEPRVARFDGLVMTHDGPGAGWSVQQGDGTAGEGPIAPPSRGRASTSTSGSSAAAPAPRSGPRIVAASDLSRMPRQPAGLDALLPELYPDEARARGIEGVARVSVLVGADGRLARPRVASQTHPGFGRACVALLQRSPRWQPGLDHGGNPVSTVIEFPCRFEVR